MKAPRDPELVRLLVLELSRHLTTFEATPPERDAVRRALHAAKGAAGLAGEGDLAATMARIEKLLAAGAITEAAASTAAGVARDAIDGLTTSGPLVDPWPTPPPALAPTPISPGIRPEYVAEAKDRLTAIDDALALADPGAAAAAAYRHVHTLKGAASAVGDEPMSWFCHGLEEILRTGDGSGAALSELARYRGVLGALVDDPETALRALRTGVSTRTRSAPPERIPLEPATTTQRASVRPEDEAEATVRVEAASIDRLFDRGTSVVLARERVASRAEKVARIAKEARDARVEILDALRRIGPARPWGAPAAAIAGVGRGAAALGAIADGLEVAAEELRVGGQSLREGTNGAKRELAEMRQTPIRKLFSRLAAAVESEARRSGRIARVRTTGGDEAVDRRLVEALADPCLQLARNAVAHGLEPPDVRRAVGKDETGTVTIEARRFGARLRVTIEDDGAGVDVAAVRARAIETGALARDLAEAADDDSLLALLFLPGFSTRGTSDLLAGRGLGLDIALGAVRRLGGAVRLSSRHGVGFSARVEVVAEAGLATVLWVRAGGVAYAMPTPYAARVRPREHGHVPHLARCVDEGAEADDPPYVLEVRLDDDDASLPLIEVGIDAAERTEDAFVRPISALLSAMGPYAGGIVREDGSLGLMIDAEALAPRVRALLRVPEANSERPRSGRPPR